MKLCQQCGEPFEPSRSDQLYCSDAHRKAAARARAASEDEYRSVFHEWLTAGVIGVGKSGPVLDITDQQHQVLEEYRALVEGTNTLGGYVCPPDFARIIIEAAVGLSAIARLATNLETTDGTALPVPLLTAHGTAVWLAEQGSGSGGTNDPVFAQGSLGGFKSMTKVVGSEELSRDSGLDLDVLLARELGKRLGALQGAAFAAGDGSGKPLGLATAAAGYTVVNAAAGSAAKYVAADIHSVWAALPAAYKVRATWLIHPTDLHELQKLAGADLTFVRLHDPSPTLLGRPVEVSPFLPTPAANAHSLAVGDIEAGYAVRRVSGIGVQKLTELHSDTGQLGWRATERIDGRPLLTDAVRLLRHTT